MTDIDTNAIRREHFQSPHGDCHICGSVLPLPCDAVRLADALDAARVRADELRGMAARCVRGECHDDALSRAEKAEATIERVRDIKPSYMGSGIWAIRVRDLTAALDGAE